MGAYLIDAPATISFLDLTLLSHCTKYALMIENVQTMHFHVVESEDHKLFSRGRTATICKLSEGCSELKGAKGEGHVR